MRWSIRTRLLPHYYYAPPILPRLSCGRGKILLLLSTDKGRGKKMPKRRSHKNLCLFIFFKFIYYILIFLFQFDSFKYETRASNKVFNVERCNTTTNSAWSSKRGSSQNWSQGVGICWDTLLEIGTWNLRAFSL